VPAATNTAVPPNPTTTARVLTRADLSPDAAQPDASGDRDEGAAGVTPGYEEAVRTLPKVGLTGPDFTLNTLEGGSVTLSSLRGHPVLINFWASWCVACRAEAPELQELYAEHKDHGLIILGVNTTQQDTVADARAYVSEFKLTIPIPMDEKGDVVKAYGVVGLPTSFFIDPRGVVRNVVIGQMSRATMLAGLELTKPW
jgi:cytochrome c biogenesis protein CcmG, thiol:disulfide interchange protein DsbE